MHWSIGQILGSFVFSADNCKVLHIGRNHERCYKMRKRGSSDKVTFEKSEIERDLGAQMDKDLRFSQHIETQVNEANLLLGLIRRSYEHLDAESMQLLFVALVRSH